MPKTMPENMLPAQLAGVLTACSLADYDTKWTLQAEEHRLYAIITWTNSETSQTQREYGSGIAQQKILTSKLPQDNNTTKSESADLLPTKLVNMLATCDLDEYDMRWTLHAEERQVQVNITWRNLENKVHIKCESESESSKPACESKEEQCKLKSESTENFSSLHWDDYCEKMYVKAEAVHGKILNPENLSFYEESPVSVSDVSTNLQDVSEMPDVTQHGQDTFNETDSKLDLDCTWSTIYDQDSHTDLEVTFEEGDNSVDQTENDQSIEKWACVNGKVRSKMNKRVKKQKIGDSMIDYHAPRNSTCVWIAPPGRLAQNKCYVVRVESMEYTPDHGRMSYVRILAQELIVSATDPNKLKFSNVTFKPKFYMQKEFRRHTFTTERSEKAGLQEMSSGNATQKWIDRIRKFIIKCPWTYGTPLSDDWNTHYRH